MEKIKKQIKNQELNYLLNFIGVDDVTDIIVNNTYYLDNKFTNKMGENYYRLNTKISKNDFMFIKNKGWLEIEVNNSKNIYYYNAEAIQYLIDRRLI